MRRGGGGRDDGAAAACPELRCLRRSNLFRLDTAAERASPALVHAPLGSEVNARTSMGDRAVNFTAQLFTTVRSNENRMSGLRKAFQREI